MLGSTSAGKTLLASAALHVGLALAVGGHAPQGVRARVAPLAPAAQEIDVTVVPVSDAPAPALEPRAPAAPRSFPTHHHPYPVAPDHDAIPHDPALVHAPLALHAPAPTPEPEAPSAVAEDSAPVRFTMTLGGSGFAHAAASPAAAEAGPATEGGDATFGESDLDARPTLVRAAPLAYPPQAAAAGVEGDVALVLVLDGDGRVVEATPLEHAGYGLDDSAVAMMRASRFTPGRHHGRPVRVRMKWTVSFRLR